MPPTSFGERVWALRSYTDLTCAELDRLAGLHRGHTWAIEQQTRENPERGTVRGLAAVLGSSVGWLLEGEGEPPTRDEVRAAVESARAAHAPEPATGTEG